MILPPLANRENISQPFYMEILTAINEEASRNSQVVSIATGASLDELVKQVDSCIAKNELMVSLFSTLRRMILLDPYLLKESSFVVIGAAGDTKIRLPTSIMTIRP